LTTAIVRPFRADGTIRAPPSKSYTHRALVVAHLSGRRCVVQYPLDADDTRTTAHALEKLGSRVVRRKDLWVVTPSPSHPARARTIDCAESGTTLRFVAALAARERAPMRFTGRGRLPARPMEDLLSALVTLGATVQRPPGRRTLPITVRGPIHSGAVRLDASKSSQFASALLLTLPSLPGASSLRLRGKIVSEPYLEATLAVLRRCGVRITRAGRDFRVVGPQKYRARRLVVPGDASSAAYLWAAAAITGGRVAIQGISSGWPQADLAVLGLLRAAGARVRAGPQEITVQGAKLRGFRVDLTSSPDLYPLAGAIAAAIPAESYLYGAVHVVLKESDRRAGTAHLAAAMGARVRSKDGGLRIRGRARPLALHLERLTDHRMVMSAAVGALAADAPSRIGDARAVRKSFPTFWTTLRELEARSGR